MTQHLGMNRQFCPVPDLIMAVKHKDYMKVVAAMDDATLVDSVRRFEMFLPLLLVTGLVAKYSQTAKDKGMEFRDVYYTPPALVACRTSEERQAARALRTRRTEGDLRRMIVEDCADLRAVVNERLSGNREHSSYGVVYDMVFRTIEDVRAMEVEDAAQIDKLSDWDLLEQWGKTCFAALLTHMVFELKEIEPEFDAQEEESMERKPR